MSLPPNNRQSSFKDKITGLVLAGGQSSRIRQTYPEGKGLLLLEDKPLVTHIIEKFKPQVSLLAISANTQLERYQNLGLPVWTDIKDNDWEAFPGPLAGILTGLMHIKTEWLATAPCDSPLLPDYLVESLYLKTLQNNAKIVISCTKTPHGLKDHPVFALFHISLKDSLHRYLSGGDRKIMLWIEQHHFERAIFTDEQGFMANINTLEDLQYVNKLIKRTSL